LSPPRSAGWLVLRHGEPVALVQNHGREVSTLAAWQSSDLAGLIAALAGVVERPGVCRPVRRIEVALWDGKPVAEAQPFPALRAANLA